jgi:hypothetical protein
MNHPTLQEELLFLLSRLSDQERGQYAREAQRKGRLQAELEA